MATPEIRKRALTEPSRRLEAVPPYLFAELERKVADKRAAGIDVISLGIGDPDHPTFAPIVEAMQAAVADPATHAYPNNRGREEFRQALASFYASRFGVELDPDGEVMPALGAKECIYNLCFAFLDPGDVALAADPGLSGLHVGAAARGRRGGADAARPRARLRPRPRRDSGRGARARAAAVHQLPQQPDRRDRPRRLLRARRRAGARARGPRRPRQRLLGDDLRRLRRAELPRHARRQGRRRRGLLAVEGLQHDRLALRGDARQPRGDPLLLEPEDERRLGDVRGRPARRRRGARDRPELQARDERDLRPAPRPRGRDAARDRRRGRAAEGHDLHLGPGPRQPHLGLVRRAGARGGRGRGLARARSTGPAARASSGSR